MWLKRACAAYRSLKVGAVALERTDDPSTGLYGGNAHTDGKPDTPLLNMLVTPLGGGCGIRTHDADHST